MKYKPTQVYLEPADHARLKAEARRRGISLAALMRELATAHVAERAPSYGDKSWDAIVAGEDELAETDVAAEAASYEAEATDALYEKKMRLARRPRRR